MFKDDNIIAQTPRPTESSPPEWLSRAGGRAFKGPVRGLTTLGPVNIKFMDNLRNK